MVPRGAYDSTPIAPSSAIPSHSIARRVRAGGSNGIDTVGDADVPAPVGAAS